MMKTKTIFIILALSINLLNAQETSQETTTEQVQEEQVASKVETQVDSDIEAQAEDKIYKLLSGGSDPFSFGSSRQGTGKSNLVPIDISNITTSIKLKGVFKLSTSSEAYALIQIGESKISRRQLVKKGDLILIDQGTRRSSTTSKTAKYLQIVEIHENTVVIAPQMRPDEQIVIR